MIKTYQKNATMALSAAIILFSTNAIAQPYTEKFSNGSVNWGSGEVSAIGFGVAPKKYAKHAARARAMAVRAAKVDAMRNLLERLEGVRVQAKTLVKDMAVQSDLVRTAMEGELRGAGMVGRPHYMEDGSVEVVMAINYRQSVAKTVMEHYGKKAAPAEAAPAPQKTAGDSSATITGLIIDAVGKGLKTALAPRILDENGNVIYSGSMVTEDKQNDIVAYDTSVSDAAKLPRLGDSPLIIKAVKVIDKTDVVISKADAAKVGQLAGMQDALRQARVSFAL